MRGGGEEEEAEEVQAHKRGSCGHFLQTGKEEKIRQGRQALEGIWARPEAKGPKAQPARGVARC